MTDQLDDPGYPTEEQLTAAREIIRTTCCGDYEEYDAPLYVERLLGQMGVAVSPEVAWLLSLIEELWTRDAHIVLSIDDGRVEFTWREEVERR